MDKTERLYRLHHLLTGRRTTLRLATIMVELGCSESTARRTIDDLRDRYQAPLNYDAAGHGWRYDTSHGEHPFELPGLWFSDTELHALLTAQEILGDIPPGLLRGEIAPLTERIQTILAKRGLKPDQLTRRIRLIPIGARPLSPRGFGLIATALLQRRRLRIHYSARVSPHTGSREVSPERLTWYRNNWYLDAWCHQAEGFRRFACECIAHPEPLDAPAKDCDERELDAYFAGAYGIFAGAAAHIAVLHFSPERTRWVADEQWHPDQQGQRLPDGRYELRLPYGNDTELLMDILRHGPEVQVIAPPALVAAARELLARALAQYA
ncbi:WYL domain-containing protein [uncultured Thiodictyon sp.]|uniref:helix-turn-helix transcriptional regulator n=1 Tax=uncultured Thiodictyon sp. TaxID=1846217 RepID=UPI0025CCB4DE|nr:WYL domain-containing protein [uncultured Thiodictyon sp.]